MAAGMLSSPLVTSLDSGRVPPSVVAIEGSYAAIVLAGTCSTRSRGSILPMTPSKSTSLSSITVPPLQAAREAIFRVYRPSLENCSSVSCREGRG